MIVARLIDQDAGFWLTENSRLGGTEITKNFSIPRTLDKEGNLRLDIFAFELMSKSDIDTFQEGQIVELTPGNKLELLEPWEAVDDLAAVLKNELAKELHENHDLFQKPLQAIAKRIDRDDVLFQLSEEEKYAVVHLTWKAKQEDSAEYPTTEFYNHWTDLYEQRILPDYRDWVD